MKILQNKTPFFLSGLFLLLMLVVAGCMKSPQRVLDSDDPNNQKGIELYSIGQYEKAMAQFDLILKKNAANATALYYKGLIFWRQGDANAGIEQLSQAISVDQKMAKAYSMRGAIYFDQDNYSKAMKDFNTAVSYDPKFVYTYVNRAALNVLIGNFDKGLADCNTALKFDSDNVNALHTRAIVYYLQNKPIGALNSDLEAIKYGGKWAMPYFIIGGIYHDIHQYDNAKKAFDQAYRLNPNVFKDAGAILSLPVDEDVKRMHKKFIKIGKRYRSLKKETQLTVKDLLEIMKSSGKNDE